MIIKTKVSFCAVRWGFVPVNVPFCEHPVGKHVSPPDESIRLTTSVRAQPAEDA